MFGNIGVRAASSHQRGNLQGVEDDLYLFKVEGSNFKFEMPSGNEIETNDLWIPVGKTSGGYREAVLINKNNSNISIIHNKDIDFLKNQFKWEKVKKF